MSRGLIRVYHGDGKGKTTAAMGLALAAVGEGVPVLMLQFMKGRPTGEVASLAQVPGVTLLRAEGLGKKFSWEMTPEEREQVKANQDRLLAQGIQMAREGPWGLLVLDEALGACATGLLEEEVLLGFLGTKPPGLEVVLTGRGPSEALLNTAQLVTEMKKQKHPYDRGIPARKGVEF